MTPLTRRSFLKLATLTFAGAAGALAADPVKTALAGESTEARAWFSAPKGSRRIALTFDDGYVNVSHLLDAARAADVRLTLFPTGKVILANPQLWRRAVDEGHEIGCHTFSHAALGALTYDGVVAELAQWRSVARDQLGLVQPRFLRPPYGDGWNAEAVQRAAKAQGFQIVMWNRVNTMKQRATAPTSVDVLNSFVDEAQAGDIVLYHFHWQEVAAFPAIVAHARAQGWKVTTVGELLNPRPTAQARLTSATRP